MPPGLPPGTTPSMCGTDDDPEQERLLCAAVQLFLEPLPGRLHLLHP